jgi:hypothetical protein
LVVGEGVIENFDNLRLVELSLFNLILFYFLLIDEEFCFHECVFGSNQLQLGHPMEGIIYLFSFPDEEPDLCL